MFWWTALLILSVLSNSTCNLSSLPYLRLEVQNKLPVLDISQYCDNQIRILLDTGSSEFWLADLDCAHCQVKGPFCPQIHQSNARVQYYTGWIQGSYSFLSICTQRSKFLCVKSIQNQQLEIGVHGILGLQIGSTGYTILNQLIKHSDILTSSQMISPEYVFSYGEYQSRLMIQCNQSNAEHPCLRISCDQQWQFAGSSIVVESQHSRNRITIQTDAGTYKYTVDSGSNTIRFPPKICQLLITQLQSAMGIQCLVANIGIYCNQKLPLSMTISLPTSTDNPDSQIHIPMEQLIDHSKNSLNIFCSPGQETKSRAEDSVIILGYPLLKAYAVGFDLERKQISLYQKQGDENGSKAKIVFFMVMYVVFICFWGLLAIKVINEYENKKSKTLTI